MTNEWQTLGNPSPASLEDARLQLHHCAQIAGAVGMHLLEPESDDSHTNLGWASDAGALAGHPASDDPSYHAALRLADLTLLLLDSGGKAANTFPLSGTKLHEGYEWLASAIESFTGKPLKSPLSPPALRIAVSLRSRRWNDFRRSQRGISRAVTLVFKRQPNPKPGECRERERLRCAVLAAPLRHRDADSDRSL